MDEQRGDGPSLHSCPAIESPITTYIRLVQQQTEAADLLEQIADSLPTSIDRPLCYELSAHLPQLLQVCWTIDERVIFPRLLATQSVSHFTQRSAERLGDERLTDQGYAIEVSELLEGYGHAAVVEDANAAGYLLRGFFENMRRSASFRLEFIVPGAQRCLTHNDREHMLQLLREESMIISTWCNATWTKIKTHKQL